ncbi:MAG TPA: glycosyltransferase family 2 protein [Verrucomicrobiae bacterium]|nr:glycosyltransferase family 2 protein [Verrucomicrobiae bacterium]
MISGAEVHRIGRALESVAGWTSEIIVVLNQDVSDGTEEAAAKWGAKIFREPWKGYLAQKNSAVEKTHSEWVLNLDADEVVSAALREEIAGLFAGSERAGSAAAFSFPRISWYCGRWIRHGDWYPDRQTRLWRRGRGHWAGIDPHPYVSVDGAVQKLRGRLEHYSTDSINSRLKKIIPFSDEFVAQRAAELAVPGFFQLALRPAWRFFRAYVVKLGFLDGWQGFYIASHTAFSTLVRYAKVRELHS